MNLRDDVLEVLTELNNRLIAEELKALSLYDLEYLADKIVRRCTPYLAPGPAWEKYR